MKQVHTNVTSTLTLWYKGDVYIHCIQYMYNVIVYQNCIFFTRFRNREILEDEMQSSPQNYGVKAWPIDPFDFKSFKQEVSEKLPQG